MEYPEDELMALSPGVYVHGKSETLVIKSREVLEFLQIEDSFENRNIVANLALKMALEHGATFEEADDHDVVD